MLSCELVLKSVTRLLKASEFISPDATNAIKVQSLLTLVVENLHATTKMKHPAPSLLDYCRHLGNVTGESIKGIKKLVYQILHPLEIPLSLPELAMDLSAIAKFNPNSSSAQKKTKE